LDEFAPDFVVIWGDDQYENFKEDVIPPFCVLAYDSLATKPWEYYRGPNVWNEPTDKAFAYQGQRNAGKFIASGMLEASMSPTPTGHCTISSATPSEHAVVPDYDRKGFPTRSSRSR
jgi:hypothetical protein